MQLGFPEWYLLIGALVIVLVWFGYQSVSGKRKRKRKLNRKPLTPEEAKLEADKLIEKVRRKGKRQGTDLE